MKTCKLISYQIILLLAILNIFYVFFGGGLSAVTLSKSFISSIYQGAIILFLLWIIGLLVSISYVAQKVITRKNLLRISLIILTVLLLVSIIGRIKEIIVGVFCINCWISTILYLILLILTITILKDLYKLAYQLFEK